jgi:hypothetical protein
MLESLADDPGNAKLRAETACRLLAVPLTHPLRWTAMERDGSAMWDADGRLDRPGQRVMVDMILDYVGDLQRGESVKDRLRGWAAEIRAGVAEMRKIGWYPLAPSPSWDQRGVE